MPWLSVRSICEGRSCVLCANLISIDCTRSRLTAASLIFAAMRWLICIFIGCAIAQAQSPPDIAAGSQNAAAVINQMSFVFSSSESVTKVQMTGSATWYAGSLEDTGSATLTASATGATTMQLSLAKKGLWTETQGPIASGRLCQFTGADDIVHTLDILQCLKPVVWFLPGISLQPKVMPTGVGVSDVGIGSVSALTKGTYRHLQSQLVFADLPNDLMEQVMQESTTDIGLDPQSFLPNILSYKLHTDDGSQTVVIPVEVHFSNYQKINGVEVPFLIQRYVNGTLQLEIKVDAAQIN